MVRFKNLERYHALVSEKDRLERSKLSKIAEFIWEDEFLYRYKRGYFKAQKYVESILSFRLLTESSFIKLIEEISILNTLEF